MVMVASFSDGYVGEPLILLSGNCKNLESGDKVVVTGQQILSLIENDLVPALPYVRFTASRELYISLP